jgi:glycine dehydrogenase subunit 1
MALAATVYLSSLGKQGLKQVANLCYQKAHYAAQQITAIPGYELLFQTPFFNEFSVRCPRPVEEINDHLLEHGILGGYDLSTDYTEFENTMLVAVTEMNTRDEIDTLCQVLGEVDHE